MGERGRVILVRPRYGGNIGAVARAVKNFGFRSLLLVSPVARVDEAARAYSMHALDVLQSAGIVGSIEEALEGVDLAVGTSAKLWGRPSNILRNYVAPRELAEMLASSTSRFAILFGPEDNGLTNSELGMCDMVVKVPTDPEYPTLNVAVAASIILYELQAADRAGRRPRQAPRSEIGIASSYLEKLLHAVEFPVHKRPLAARAFRNILGRAAPSPREASLLLGVLRKTLAKLARDAGAQASYQ